MIERLATAAMGTRFELVLADAHAADTPRARRRLRAAGEEALEVIRTCEARWSAFRRDSLVSRVRREADPVRLDPETYELLAACLELWHATGGAFDVGLGGAMAALGFRGRAALRSAFERSAEPPFSLDAATRSVRTTRAGAQLDLGGVAKGFALDLAARELREAGVECALLHGGTSSVVAIGAPPAERDQEPGWRVAVQAPLEVETELVAVLRDTSLSVSAPHGRTAPGADGRSGGHVLAPHSGVSAPLGCAACVVASSGLAADALATALVAGAPPGQNPPPLPPGSAAALSSRAEPRWVLRGDRTSVFETRTHQNS